MPGSYLPYFAIVAFAIVGILTLEGGWPQQHSQSRCISLEQNFTQTPAVQPEFKQDGILSTAIAVPMPPQGLREYEVMECSKLRLSYFHIYKNGGTTANSALNRFCKQTTGESGKFHRSWIEEERVPSFDDLCQNSFCYTFWRDPVDRFISSYHEIMRRTNDGTQNINNWMPSVDVLRDIGLPEDASKQQKTESFRKFFDLVESGKFVDPHVQNQVNFLSSTGGKYPNVSNLATFDLRRADEVTEIIFCGAYHSALKNNDSCPFDPIIMHRTRDRNTGEYGKKQYVIDEEDLEDHLLERIAGLYCKDYCYFGIPMHRRAKIDTLSCC